MPYIDTTPAEYLNKFEEDNLIESFGAMLTSNGWTRELSFIKVAVDPKAYPRTKATGEANYAIARHTIFRNSDGAFLGIAEATAFTQQTSNINNSDTITENFIIRRIEDDTDESDVNFGKTPSYKDWVRRRLVERPTAGNLYFYQIEKLPNTAYVKDGDVVSIVASEGMSGVVHPTVYDTSTSTGSLEYPTIDVGLDANINTTIQHAPKAEASKNFLLRASLDVEVFKTSLPIGTAMANNTIVTSADPRVMQSPIAHTTLRTSALSTVDDPVWHTNWWTDSEVQVKGYVDSTTLFLTLQGDNAPAWTHDMIPTVPLYFGRIIDVDDPKKHRGYALFTGSVPKPVRIVGLEEEIKITVDMENNGERYTIETAPRSFPVNHTRGLPRAPFYAILDVGEIVIVNSYTTNNLNVTRAVANSPLTQTIRKDTAIRAISMDSGRFPEYLRTSMFDYDNLYTRSGETIQPLLKMYISNPSNGVDSVMVSKSAFGARYQSHYLSWGTSSNEMPPEKFGEQGEQYPRAYADKSYQYQFNTSKYSGKVHSSRIFVVHPEEGVRGYLAKAISFNSQNMKNTTLKLRKESCPEQVFEMYKFQSTSGISPLTKKPVTAFRPMGIAIYSHDRNEKTGDVNSGVAPKLELVEAYSKEPSTMFIEWNTENVDTTFVDIYVNGNIYATNVHGTTTYKLGNLQSSSTPEVMLKAKDSFGNETAGIPVNNVKIL